MALIKCQECGKEISQKATNCPHCGNPVQAPGMGHGIQKAIAFLMIAVGVVAGIGGAPVPVTAVLIFGGLAWFVAVRIMEH